MSEIVNKLPLTMEYVGEYKYLVIYESGYNKEQPEYYVLVKGDDDIDPKNPEWKLLARRGHKVRLFWSDEENVKKMKVYVRYYLFERKENWQNDLLDFVDKYTEMDDIPAFDALQSCYNCIQKIAEKNGEFRWYVNGDKKHAIDFNEFMVRIILPIEQIEGDVYYWYLYEDRYLVIREFIHNKIYVNDFFTEENRNAFEERWRKEKFICKTRCVEVKRDSQMYQTTVESDKQRIQILLNPKSKPELRDKAKG